MAGVSLTVAMNVTEEIRQANSILRGQAAPDGQQDPRRAEEVMQ